MGLIDALLTQFDDVIYEQAALFRGLKWLLVAGVAFYGLYRVFKERAPLIGWKNVLKVDVIPAYGLAIIVWAIIIGVVLGGGWWLLGRP